MFHSRRLVVLMLLASVPLSFVGFAAAPTPAAHGESPSRELFNESHHTLLQLVGEWQVVSIQGTVRLRPVGTAGRVVLLELGTGIAREQEVPIVGELALGKGWITINHVDQETF